MINQGEVSNGALPPPSLTSKSSLPRHSYILINPADKEKMARAKYITDFEKDVIRIGVANGIKAPAIARFLGRKKMAIYRHIELLEQDGTLGNVPMEFVADEIAAAIKAKEAAQ